jgi:predicted aldo/keto reductase-like oxidoreductase
VNLPVILWLLNLANAYDMVKYGQMRYNLLGSGGHWFPGQNAGNLDDQAITQALGDTPLARKVPELLRDAHQRLAKEPVKRLSEG